MVKNQTKKPAHIQENRIEYIVHEVGTSFELNSQQRRTEGALTYSTLLNLSSQRTSQTLSEASQRIVRHLCPIYLVDC